MSTDTRAVWLLGLALCVGVSTCPTEAQALQRALSEPELCRAAEWVFIGRVVRRDSIMDPRPSVLISSRVEMRVESVAHGAPPPLVRFGIQGGEVDGKRYTVEDSPAAEVGSRYLIFGHLGPVRAGWGLRDRVQLDNQTASQPALTLVRHFLLKVGPRVPSTDDLTAIWDEHCQPSAGGRHSSKPTQKYLEFLPPSLLSWCEHY